MIRLRRITAYSQWKSDAEAVCRWAPKSNVSLLRENAVHRTTVCVLYLMQKGYKGQRSYLPVLCFIKSSCSHSQTTITKKRLRDYCEDRRIFFSRANACPVFSEMCVEAFERTFISIIPGFLSTSELRVSFITTSSLFCSCLQMSAPSDGVVFRSASPPF